MATLLKSFFACILLSSSISICSEKFSLENLSSYQPAVLTKEISHIRKTSSLETIITVLALLQQFKDAQFTKLSNNKKQALTNGIAALIQRQKELESKPKITDLSQSAILDINVVKTHASELADEAAELAQLEVLLEQKKRALEQKETSTWNTISHLMQRLEDLKNQKNQRQTMIEDNTNLIQSNLKQIEVMLKQIETIKAVKIPQLEECSTARRKSIELFDKQISVLNSEITKLQQKVPVKTAYEKSKLNHFE